MALSVQAAVGRGGWLSETTHTAGDTSEPRCGGRAQSVAGSWQRCVSFGSTQSGYMVALKSGYCGRPLLALVFCHDLT
jgi:hypothetical protein